VRRAASLTAAAALAVVQAQAQPVAEPDAWAFSASVYAYSVPHETDFLQPSVTADRGRLHLGARYNYEEQDTASVWMGGNFSGGQALWWEVTPMVGLVFGDVGAIAPGYSGSVGWWKLELYSEGDWVPDTSDSSESYTYSWSELALAPVDWFRFGIVTQRTRVYESERDLERGWFLGFSYEMVDLTAYVLDPDESDPTSVFAVTLSW
jgi:hypothetical protein